MTEKKWEKFEQLVEKIQKDLAGTATVTRNDKIEGKNSGTKRQIDVSVRQKVGQFELLVAIECKDLARPVDVTDVESFTTKIRDIEAHQGAMVSASGFTEAAKASAKSANIKLYRAVDTDNHDWKVEIGIPVVFGFAYIASTQLTIAATGGFGLAGDLLETDFYDSKGQKIGTTRQLIHKLWNQEKIPQTPGVHDGIVVNPEGTGILFNGEFCVCTFTASLTVKMPYHFGYLPLKQISGFKDEIGGGIVTNKITTADLEPAALAKTWQEIDSPTDAPVPPFFVLEGTDYYSE